MSEHEMTGELTDAALRVMENIGALTADERAALIVSMRVVKRLEVDGANMLPLHGVFDAVEQLTAVLQRAHEDPPSPLEDLLGPLDQ